jgi:Mg2+-importing ATPase
VVRLSQNGPAGEPVFQSRWFIESLLTSLIMAVGLYLPFSTLGSAVSLAHVPRAFFGWLLATLLAYGVLTQLVKTRYLRRFHAWL